MENIIKNSSAKKKSRIYFPNADMKYHYWATELRSLGIDTEIMKYYSVSSLLKIILLPKHHNTYFVIRYLNDSRGIIKTMLQVSFLFLLCLILRMRGFKIWWFCHNVDRETYVWHRHLNQMKRQIAFAFCEKIFVMDPLLVEPAKNIFGVKKRIVPLCFGEFATITNFGSKSANQQKIDTWMQSNEFYKFENRIICVTSSQPKNKSVNLFKKLLQNNNCVGLLIYDGDLLPYDNLQQSDKLLIVNEKHDISSDIFAQFTHLIKCSHDLSINLSAYAAASSNLIIVSDGYGFLGDLIRNGDVVGEICKDGKLERMQKERNFNKFLNDRSWRKAAEKIKTELCD